MSQLAIFSVITFWYTVTWRLVRNFQLPNFKLSHFTHDAPKSYEEALKWMKNELKPSSTIVNLSAINRPNCELGKIFSVNGNCFKNSIKLFWDEFNLIFYGFCGFVSFWILILTSIFKHFFSQNSNPVS